MIILDEEKCFTASNIFNDVYQKQFQIVTDENEKFSAELLDLKKKMEKVFFLRFFSTFLLINNFRKSTSINL